MTNINQELRKAFDASFEELSITDPRPPDFSMWGKSYLGKWKQHTMTMFLNDLNDLVQGKQDVIDEAEVTKDEKIESLEFEIEDLKAELEKTKEELEEANA